MIVPAPFNVFVLKQDMLYVRMYVCIYVVLIILMITLEDKQLFVVGVLFCFYLSTDERLRGYVVLVELLVIQMEDFLSLL